MSTLCYWGQRQSLHGNNDSALQQFGKHQTDLITRAGNCYVIHTYYARNYGRWSVCVSTRHLRAVKWQSRLTLLLLVLLAWTGRTDCGVINDLTCQIEHSICSHTLSHTRTRTNTHEHLPILAHMFNIIIAHTYSRRHTNIPER